MAQVAWALKKSPDGYEGWIRLPNALITCPRASRRAGRVVQRRGPVAIKATGRSKRGALMNAANAAERLLENPLIKSAMPPGTGTALKATKLIAKHGPGIVKKFGGKGAKRLAKALKFW